MIIFFITINQGEHMSASRKYWIGQTITGFVLAVIFGVLIVAHEPLTAYIAAAATCGLIGVVGVIRLATMKG